MAIQRIILDVAMLDGTEREGIVVTTADRMKLANTARRQKWGGLGDEQDADRSTTFLAYAAMSRLGHFQGSWEEFIDASETISSSDGGEVDPTKTATRDE